MKGHNILEGEFSSKLPHAAEGARVEVAHAQKKPIIIRKYNNRRLYDTNSSSYITLAQLGDIAKSGQDFQVLDAKNGEDLTRSVLASILLEEEGREEKILPLAVLKLLISLYGLYGKSFHGLVPSYLEMSLDMLLNKHQEMTDALQRPTGLQAVNPLLSYIEKNFQLFNQSMTSLYGAYYNTSRKTFFSQEENRSNEGNALESDEWKGDAKYISEIISRLDKQMHTIEDLKKDLAQFAQKVDSMLLRLGKLERSSFEDVSAL